MDGTGAALQGGRWNSPGVAPIYSAANYSAAFLELIVQMGRVALLPTYHYCHIDVPDQVIIEQSNFNLDDLSNEAATRGCGNRWWKEGRTAVLCVPSAVTRVDSNYLLNSNHPQFALLKVSNSKPVWVDSRLTAAAQGWKSTAQ